MHAYVSYCSGYGQIQLKREWVSTHLESKKGDLDKEREREREGRHEWAKKDRCRKCCDE